MATTTLIRSTKLGFEWAKNELQAYRNTVSIMVKSTVILYSANPLYPRNPSTKSFSTMKYPSNGIARCCNGNLT